MSLAMKAIMLCVQGLTPATLGCYGNERQPTEHVDRFSRTAVVFDQHLADVPSVAGSRSAFLFGRHRFPGSTQAAIGPDLRIRLHEQGARSCLVTDNPDGFSDGWDAVLDDVETALEAVSESEHGLLVLEESLLPPWAIPDEVIAEVFKSDDEETASLEPWLDPKPGIIWAADEVDFQRLQRTFTAVVRDWDQRFRQLLDMLEEVPWFDEALFIVTSGRGQALGEHGMCGDFRAWLHEELVHIPLLVRLPHTEQGGRRVFHLTQSVDIPATILDFFGGAKPDQWHGRSLLPLCRGGGPVRDYACLALEVGESMEYALRTPDDAVLLPERVPTGDPAREPMYFVKPDDRWEVNNLRQSNLDYAEALEKTLRAYVAASMQPGPLAVPPLPQPGE